MAQNSGPKKTGHININMPTTFWWEPRNPNVMQGNTTPANQIRANQIWANQIRDRSAPLRWTTAFRRWSSTPPTTAMTTR